MNKALVALMIICMLFASCRKEPSVRRTDISGQVTHYGKTYAEQGIKVAAIAYYRTTGLFGGVIPKLVDSAVTDANGNYTMRFSIDLSKVDSMYVIGFNTQLSTLVRVQSGKINEHIDLSATALLPVVAYKLRVINNNNPPLVLSFSPVDSIIVTTTSADMTAYRVNHSLSASSYARNDKINASFSGYYYQAGVKKTGDLIEANLPYQDTINLPVTVDASLFQP